MCFSTPTTELYPTSNFWSLILWWTEGTQDPLEESSIQALEKKKTKVYVVLDYTVFAKQLLLIINLLLTKNLNFLLLKNVFLTISTLEIWFLPHSLINFIPEVYTPDDSPSNHDTLIKIYVNFQ